MKRVAFIRHGKKSGELISPEQIQEIEKNGIPGLNEILDDKNNVSICLGSSLERTKQAAMAFNKYLESKSYGPRPLIAADKRFGNAELFKLITSNQKLMDLQMKVGWIKSFEQVDPELLLNIQQSQFLALNNIFEEISEDEVAVVIGHTPMIELLAIFSDEGVDENLSLKELQGVLFQQTDGCEITVAQMIGK